MSEQKEYSASNIKVLEGLEGVRKKFDIVELRKSIKKRGNIYTIAQELDIKYSSLKHAFEEERILKVFPNIHKSKANALSRLKTERELNSFSEAYDVNKLSARKLYDAVKKWRKDIEINPLILLTQEEHDLMIGSLLGDASIRQRDKNSCFRVSHSVRQKSYIKWKLELLKFFTISEFSNTKRMINNHEINMINLSTRTHYAFNYYRNLFYNKEGRKVVNMAILDGLTPRALAIWICDDGSYDNKQGYIVLCTNAFSFEEHKLMKKFFNERFSLDPTIGFRDGKYYYLRFKQKDTKKLIEIIKPFIIDSMKYKIGEKENDY